MMNRKGFLGAIAALIAAPRALKAVKFDKLVKEPIPPSKEELVYFTHYEYSYPIDGIPTIDLSLASAPARTICNYCGRRYDKHAWTGPKERRISLRNICDSAPSPYGMVRAAEDARKMNLGLDY